MRTLPTLLDPQSSPAVLGGTGGASGGLGVSGKSGGMITLMELSGSFELADDDDDGLISFDEAMEAMESAFSGTHFRGAEMVRDTLLLSHPASSGEGSSGDVATGGASGASFAPDPQGAPLPVRDVALPELALLAARGLRHDPSGPRSALGTVQGALDGIVRRCARDWARAALGPAGTSFAAALRERVGAATTSSDMEWRRLNGLIEEEDDVLLKRINEAEGDESKLKRRSRTATPLGEVSPHVASFLLAVASVLNRSVCPADSLPPVPSEGHAAALGISIPEGEEDRAESVVPNMLVTIRGSLLGEALSIVCMTLDREMGSKLETSDDDNGFRGEDRNILEKFSPSALVQLYTDTKFLHRCFFERNRHGFFLLASDDVDGLQQILNRFLNDLSVGMDAALKDEGGSSTARGDALQRQAHVFASCDLYLSSLFGEDKRGEFSSSTNGAGGVAATFLSSSSSQPLAITPLQSSRRFVLLPIQAERSLAELRLRGKYGKKAPEEKAGGKDVSSGNALGTGFGFLSSMLNKTR